MAGVEQIIETRELKTTHLNQERKANKIHPTFSFRYDDRADSALVLLVQPQEGLIVHYIDDHIGFLHEENSLEIVGLRIDAFARKFLPANQNVQHLWLDIKHDKVSDFGQLTVMFERIQPQVIQEVVRATWKMLGEQGSELASLVGISR
ncbi:MAG TPA: hypothetical protein VKQ72_07100 [Aggregatilineales bacterium]|nr:hypothetical protein [Aggregatilineales bacterium]